VNDFAAGWCADARSSDSTAVAGFFSWSFPLPRCAPKGRAECSMAGCRLGGREESEFARLVPADCVALALGRAPCVLLGSGAHRNLISESGTSFPKPLAVYVIG